MNRVLGELNPQNVFNHFEDLTRIPRGSGNEKGVSDFLYKFAKDCGLEVIQDEFLNIIINKPATKGYENAPKVILQGHMDIVCAKIDGLNFDFEKDPIKLIVEDDMIRTAGTTLGADNGIAVAMIMAILESKEIEHPALCGLVTVSEETGMDGALNLKSEDVSGDILINIDAEEEGTLICSCAGGVQSVVEIPITWNTLSTEKETYEIKVTGLLGGHSGMEINKNRANSIKLLGRVLETLDKNINYDIANVFGGQKMNIIANEARVVITLDSNHVKTLDEQLSKLENIFKNEFKTADSNVKITYSKLNNIDTVMGETTKTSLVNVLRLLPFSIQTMSAEIEGLVESSANVGVISTNNKCIKIENSIRSSVRTLKDEIAQRIDIISKNNSANMSLVSDYPEWEYKLNSPIRDLMGKVYLDMYGQEIEIDAIHAGLECGLLKEKVGDIDMISMGPNIYDVHTPNEHLSISSTERVFDFLCEVLRRIK